MSLSALLLTLIIGLGLVYLTQAGGELAAGGGTGPGRRAPKLRSTDYVD
jgi:hypothetical protein